MSVEGGVGSGGGGAAVKIKAACFAAPQSGLTRTEDGRRSRVTQDMTRSRTHDRPIPAPLSVVVVVVRRC